jgi:hypothetical protein
MPLSDLDDGTQGSSSPPTKTGYRCPPEQSRFKPGQSGNPSGRAKGSQNFTTLFNKVLDEEIALRDGADVKKISKAEAIIRSVVVGAMKGDSRNVAVLFRLAEQAGRFEQPTPQITEIRLVGVRCDPNSEGETDVA